MTQGTGKSYNTFMILILDNYDSFTYNLVQRIGELQNTSARTELKVVRNDKITVPQVLELKPDRIIISPGPCTPRQAGISVALVQAAAGKIPLMGVCLGHQSIGEAFGMIVERNERIMHGKTSPMHHDGKGLFVGLSNPFIATRYHSLVIRRDSLDEERFELTAWTEEGEIMGLRAKPGVFGPAPLEGVQFHPESFLTDEGPMLLKNFLDMTPPGSTPVPDPC